MKEMRVDALTNDMVIFAEDRTKRPIDKVNTNDEEEIVSEYEKDCPFCKGNEKYIPEETFKIEDENGWVCKSIYNKFPIIDQDSENIKGVHEVIIETSKHNKTFYNMNVSEFENLFTIYKNRYESLSKCEDTEYISIFKNFLRKAGASLQHPHSQIVSLPIIPPEVNNEIEIAKKYYDTNNRSLYEDIIKEEISYGKRVIHNSENFLVIVPYATKYNGEVRIIFKQNIKLNQLKIDSINEISNIFVKLFENLYNERGYMPFNLFIHTHPVKGGTEKYYNTHIHIVPRRYSFGGFELSMGVYVASTNPEQLAQRLKF